MCNRFGIINIYIYDRNTNHNKISLTELKLKIIYAYNSINSKWVTEALLCDFIYLLDLITSIFKMLSEILVFIYLCVCRI